LVLLELDQLEGSKNVDAPVESLISFWLTVNSVQ
jgi:hypothetical protein